MRRSIVENIRNGRRPQNAHEVPSGTQESAGYNTETKAESDAESTYETSLEPRSETDVIKSDIFDVAYL